MPKQVKYPIFIIPPSESGSAGDYIAVGEQFGLYGHGIGTTREEALAELRKNIEERMAEIRKYHGMMPTPMTEHAELTTIEVTLPDVLL